MANTVDIQSYKYIKEVMKYGIPKYVAKEIVTCALNAGNGACVGLYIKYAINLTYGLGLSHEDSLKKLRNM